MDQPAPPVPAAPALIADGGVAETPSPAEVADAAPPPAASAVESPVVRRRGFQEVALRAPLEAAAWPPPRRELDTNGIPIVRQRAGMVAQAHRNVQRRRAQERAAGDEERVERPPAAAAGGPAPAERAGVSSAPMSGDQVTVAEARSPRMGERLPATASAPAQPVEAARTEAVIRSEVPAVAAEREQPNHPIDAPQTPAADVQSRPAASGGRADETAIMAAETAEPAGGWQALWRQRQRERFEGRCCATCRDFRESDTPGRGWCVNSFAFQHRQLVNEDDLACLGPLGCWWVASDRFWLEKAGATPTQPTPLADGLIQLLVAKQRKPRAYEPR